MAELSEFVRVRVGRGLLLALPGLVALACGPLVHTLPEDTVLAQALSAILSAAPPWLALVWIPWAIVGAWRTGLWGPGLACAILGLVFMGRPVATLPQDIGRPDDAVTVLLVNVNAFSDDPDVSALESRIAAQSADVVVVLELRGKQVPGMRRVADNFDTRLARVSHATAVFCRDGFACEAEVTPEFGTKTSHMPVALVSLGNGLCLLGAHAPPPVPLNPTGLRPYMEAVAAHIEAGRLVDDWGPCRGGDAAVLSGDLNSVPGMPVVSLIHSRGMRDALRGGGVFAASWPAGGGWPNLPVFPLDHLLVGDANVSDVRQVRVPGSDHIGVRFRLWPATR
jgi:endonuclease/exonuclease/phosphatase (EEP) superfamily protein YafD